jgi:hypothetical protein
MPRYLWFKDTVSRGGKIQKMLFVESEQPSDIDMKTGERIEKGPPYYQTHMKEVPINGIPHKVYFRQRLSGGYIIYFKMNTGEWYRGKGWFFTDRLFTTKKRVERFYKEA